jgi:hypothetical protein
LIVEAINARKKVGEGKEEGEGRGGAIFGHCAIK